MAQSVTGEHYFITTAGQKEPGRSPKNLDDLLQLLRLTNKILVTQNKCITDCQKHRNSAYYAKAMPTVSAPRQVERTGAR